ncbi:SLC13 family permease [Thalassiella azotivora]
MASTRGTDERPGNRRQGPDDPAASTEDRRSPTTVWAFRGLGLGVAAAVWLALGSATQITPEARTVAAVGALMATWWMSEAIPLSATALLPIVLFPATGVLGVGEATAPYADPIVFLFMGGFLIAIAMQKWQLHRRIALLTLRAVGTHPRRIVLGMMIATAFLSMWVSNTATTLMMLPIAMSVLTLVVERTGAASSTGDAGADDHDVAQRVAGGESITDVVDDRAVKVFGVGLVLSIAWSASIGGLGTLLGSPPNAIVAGYVNEQLDRQIGFLEWMQLGVPIVVVFVAVAWVLITRVLYRSGLEEVPGGREMITGQLEEMGPPSRGEKVVLAVFGSAAFLWIVPGLLMNVGAIERAAPWLGELDDTAIAIAAGIVLFMLPADRRGTMALQWDDAQKGLPWGVLLLFGGGLSLASAVAASELDAWFGAQVEGLGVLPTVLLVGAVVAIVLMLTEVTSNTATAATFIPVLGGVALGIGADGMTLLVPAALAATCAFMLPVGTPPNAIVFGSGAVTIGQMARGGAVLNVVGVVLITVMAWLLGGWALGLQF